MSARPQAAERKRMSDEYKICLRLNPEERERLETDAKRYRLSKTAYLRSLIMGRPVKEDPSQEVKLLQTEIHQIGNNINQIARSVNAGIADERDARQGLLMLNKVYELMYRTAKR